MDHVVVGIEVRVTSGELCADEENVAVYGIDELRIAGPQRRLVACDGEKSGPGGIQARNSVCENELLIMITM